MRTASGQPQARQLSTIIETLRAELVELRRKYRVCYLGVFGSYVQGHQRKTSDVDLLVEFEPGTRMTLFKFVQLQEYLSEVLGLQVDLVMKSALKPAIGDRILEEVVAV